MINWNVNVLVLCYWGVKEKGKMFPLQARRVGRGIALLFHDRGTRRRWVVSSTTRLYFIPGKDPVPIIQEAGFAPGPVWTGGKSRPTGIRSRDRTLLLFDPTILFIIQKHPRSQFFWAGWGEGRDVTFRLVSESNQNGGNLYNDVLSSFRDRSAIMCGDVYIAVAELGEMGYMIDHYA